MQPVTLEATTELGSCVTIPANGGGLIREATRTVYSVGPRTTVRSKPYKVEKGSSLKGDKCPPGRQPRVQRLRVTLSRNIGTMPRVGLAKSTMASFNLEKLDVAPIRPEEQRFKIEGRLSPRLARQLRNSHRAAANMEVTQVSDMTHAATSIVPETTAMVKKNWHPRPLVPMGILLPSPLPSLAGDTVIFTTLECYCTSIVA